MFCILCIHFGNHINWLSFQTAEVLAFTRGWLKSDSKAGRWWTNDRADLRVLTNKMVDYSCSKPSEVLPLEEEEGKYYSLFNRLYG